MKNNQREREIDMIVEELDEEFWIASRENYDSSDSFYLQIGDGFAEVDNEKKYEKRWKSIKEKLATSILSKLQKDETVIFKAKLTKGVNLSKVIEQVLYPKYIDKEIIIRVVEDE